MPPCVGILPVLIYLDDVIVEESCLFLTEQSVDDAENDAWSCFTVDGLHTLHQELERLVDIRIASSARVFQCLTQLRVALTTRSYQDRSINPTPSLSGIYFLLQCYP